MKFYIEILQQVLDFNDLIYPEFISRRLGGLTYEDE